MKAVLTNLANKQLARLNEPAKSRISNAIKNLEKEPPKGDIKKMQGEDGYRLRIGGYRIKFDIKNGFIIVATIAPRGDAYKG